MPQAMEWSAGPKQPEPTHDPHSPPLKDPPDEPIHDPAGDPTYEPQQPFGDPTPMPGGDPRPQSLQVNASGRRRLSPSNARAAARWNERLSLGLDGSETQRPKDSRL